MEKEIIKVGVPTITKITYTTKFKGCQCYKNCNCYEDWLREGNPKKVIVYKVESSKPHRFNTLEEAESFINTNFNK